MPPQDPIPPPSQFFGARRKPRPATPQLSFDLAPPEAAAPPAPLTRAPEPAPRVYKISQLIAAIKTHVETTFPSSINVEGEISNYRPASSGHVYFTLKDGESQLPVVMFRSRAQLLAFKPKDGLAVEVKGRVAVYETRGQVQLIADSLTPRGAGALRIAFEQLYRRLRAEGLFDRPKRPLPPFPHCVGIVTSAHGAALRDIVNVVRRRHARLNLLIYPAAMQGPHSPRQVIRGIAWFNHQSVPHSSQRSGIQPPCVDLILIARGGGSLEDLAGFNDEALARAIAASRLPIITGIGHEIDTTIADLVADLRAPTPSAAAELITAAQHRIEDRVLSLERRVHRAGELHLLRARRRFERLSAAQVLLRLRESIQLRQQRIDDLRFRLLAALRNAQTRRHRRQHATLAALEARLRTHDPALRLAAANARHTTLTQRLARLETTLISTRRIPLTRAHDRLEALNPLAVLTRGYSITFTPSGATLTDPAQAPPGTTLQTRLAKGTLTSTVLPNKQFST